MLSGALTSEHAALQRGRWVLRAGPERVAVRVVHAGALPRPGAVLRAFLTLVELDANNERWTCLLKDGTFLRIRPEIINGWRNQAPCPPAAVLTILAYRQVVVGLAAEDAKCRVE